MIQYLQRLSLSKVYLHRERVSLVGTDLLSVRTEGVPLLCVGMDDLLQDTPPGNWIPFAGSSKRGIYIRPAVVIKSHSCHIRPA